jgi:glutamate-1-semialdehyde 2,1-aminomutase
MEPMNTTYPNPGFLEQVKAETHKVGAVLVFDETITGFRFASGGAQELFGVTPDLSTFGKGMANGFPLSAVVGRRDIMMEMEEIFFSGTFGGELLSLAAAQVVLTRFKNEPISEMLGSIGTRIIEGVESLQSFKALDGIASFTGHPTWKFISFSNSSEFSVNQIKTLFLQEMFSQGVLILGSHNILLGIDEKDIRRVINAYDNSFRIIQSGIQNGDLDKQLRVAPPPPPLFRVR